MFAHLVVHHPRPGHADGLLESMHSVDAAAQGTPGLIQIGAWRDERSDRIIGLALWESREAFTAAAGKIFSVVDPDQLAAVLERAPDTFHLTQA